MTDIFRMLLFNNNFTSWHIFHRLIYKNFRETEIEPFSHCTKQEIISK